MFRKTTLVTGGLERAFFKAYKELERIKAARENQPEQPEKSEESQKSDPSPAINLYWVNPKTGEKTLAAQTPEQHKAAPTRTAISGFGGPLGWGYFQLRSHSDKRTRCQARRLW
jgi:hypothetical protein